MADKRKAKKTIIVALLLLVLGAAFCFSNFLYVHYRYPLKYRDLIEKNAADFGLEPSLVASVIFEESRFKADAKSGAGAQGLMQIMPDTASFIAKNLGESLPQNITEPEVNIRYGSWYLKYLLGKSGNDEKAALASYNAGPGNVASWQSQGQKIQFKETADFVSRLEKSKNIYQQYYFNK